MQNENQNSFNLKKLQTNIKIIDDDVQQIVNIDAFINICREITKIFMEMGGILKKAFQDITDKCNIIQNNYTMHKEIHGPLINFILFEKNKDIAKFNGENSDKFGCNKGDFYYKYESTARTILRLMWFLDFIIELLEQLLQDENKSFSSICTTAYNKALGPNHSFTIRTAVKAGLLTVGNKDNFYKILFKENENKQQEMMVLKNSIKKLTTRLWDLYQQENLCQLP